MLTHVYVCMSMHGISPEVCVACLFARPGNDNTGIVYLYARHEKQNNDIAMTISSMFICNNKIFISNSINTD